MKRVAFKSLLYLALLLMGAQLLIKPFVYHPFWGDPDYISKYDHFFKEENDYNTVFIGSSRTFKFIDPLLFDSITGTKSFNFGIEGVGCPFNYLLAKEILRSGQAAHLDHIILELFSPEGNLNEATMHADKVIYRYGWNDFYFTMRSTWHDTNLSLREKVGEFSLHFRNLLETAFRFGQVHRTLNSKDKPTRDRLGENGRGFVNDDADLRAYADSFLLISHNELLLHPELLEERARFSNGQNDTTEQRCDACFQYHWKYLLELQRQCAAKGIDLVLLVQPLMNEKQVHFFNRFLRTAPATFTILNYSSSTLYPAYYQPDNVFNIGHLNTQGAHIFTSNLATDFNRLSKK